MAAISAALAWVAAPDSAAKGLILVVLVVNSVLNIAWSGIFFKMRRPDWALIEVALLWLSILALIVVLGRYSTTAGLLMVPYLVWVSIAAFLNYRIVQMNRPFA
jgi:benzodiazapine receptor